MITHSIPITLPPSNDTVHQDGASLTSSCRYTDMSTWGSEPHVVLVPKALRKDSPHAETITQKDFSVQEVTDPLPPKWSHD